ADLTLAVDLGVLRAAPHRPDQPADAFARFEDMKIVPEPAELVPGRETGNARTEHENFLRAARPSGQRRPDTRLPGHQIERLHRRHHERRAADEAELFEKPATGEHVLCG